MSYVADNNAFATPAYGLRSALPIIAAYLPLGFATGVVGVNAGLSPAEVALLSLLMYAGSAQFVFAGLIGGSPIVLIATVFLINFRYFFCSAAMALKLKHLSTAARTLLGAQLTDEGFALMTVWYKPQHGFGGLLTLNMSCYIAWACGSTAGAISGGAVGDEIGADFMLIAMFAAILMLAIRAAKHLAAALMAVCIAAFLIIALELWQPGAYNIILAPTLAAAVTAFYYRKRYQHISAADLV